MEIQWLSKVALALYVGGVVLLYSIIPQPYGAVWSVKLMEKKESLYYSFWHFNLTTNTASSD